jgi:hypothetical protein
MLPERRFEKRTLAFHQIERRGAEVRVASSWRVSNVPISTIDEMNFDKTGGVSSHICV